MGVGPARHFRICPECLKGWQSNRSDSRYCSGRCRMRAMRKAEAAEKVTFKRLADERAAEMARQADERAVAAAIAAAAPKPPQASRAKSGQKPKVKAKVRGGGKAKPKVKAKGRAK